MHIKHQTIFTNKFNKHICTLKTFIILQKCLFLILSFTSLKIANMTKEKIGQSRGKWGKLN